MSDAARRVFRHEVPVDDRWHEFELTGPILHVATRNAHKVELWTLADLSAEPVIREFRAFGTGHALTDDTGPHVGSVVIPGGALVWHLFERQTL